MSIKDVGLAGGYVGTHETDKVELTIPGSAEKWLDSQGNPMWIEVYGPDSANAKAVEKDINQRLLNQQNRSRGKNGLQDFDQIQNTHMERLIRNVASWYLELGDGSNPDCTYQNVKELFELFSDVRIQIEEAREDTARFLKRSSTTSKRSPSTNSGST